jgi:DnaK suppressor protein
MATVHVGTNADPHSEHHAGSVAPCRRRLLRRTDRAVKLVGVGPLDIPRLLALVEAEQERTARQIASLEGVVAAIVEASELISTDDEHDPEGPTIAYERAQATALLRQARADLDALVIRRRQLELGRQVVCAACGRDINLERVAALPTTSRCIECAS